MKIRTIILSVMLAILSAKAFAANTEIKPILIEPQINEISSPKPVAKKETIQPLNLDKMMAEAEVYFRAAKSWNKLKCVPKSGFVCTKKECTKRVINSFMLLDKKKETISRCDGKICEKFPAEFKQTGVFFNIQTEGLVGTLIRVLGNSRYKEVTTVGLDAYIVNGECEEVLE